MEKTIENTLSGLKNKDLKVFEELFFKYHGRLVLFANKFIGDEHVAQDLVQDVFVNLWEKAGQLEIKQSPKSYLYQAVKNICLNHTRHLSIKQNASIEITNTFYKEADKSDIPSFGLIEIELEEKINQIIEGMPEKCKEVFKLSRFECLKNKEIADQLDISVKMVEKHISKALSIMRSDLAEYMSILLLTILFRK